MTRKLVNKDAVLSMKDYMEKNNEVYIGYGGSKVDRRAAGEAFSLKDHVQAMIYSMLSNMRGWAAIEAHAAEIDEIFFNYDIEKIKEHSSEYFAEKIFAIKCGNLNTRKQMAALHHNIGVMERLTKEYGSMDAFVTSDKLSVIVDKLSNYKSEYKLKTMLVALVCEYLRNVGVDTAKPDVHMKRILGSERLGISKNVTAGDGEVIDTFKRLSDETGFSASDLDYLFWSYCANGKGEICTANPACDKCVIREYCNRGGN